MLPRWHIVLGLIFTLFIWIIIPDINKFYLSLVFLSSVFIDFDHYLVSLLKTKKLSLFHAFNYHKEKHQKYKKDKQKGLRKKGDFHVFHTIEFHILIAILSYFLTPFLFIFIGMVFHSLTDLIYLLHTDLFYLREYFLINWILIKQ